MIINPTKFHWINRNHYLFFIRHIFLYSSATKTILSSNSNTLTLKLFKIIKYNHLWFTYKAQKQVGLFYPLLTKYEQNYCYII